MTNQLGEYTVADTQYNDLAGTIALDGFDGPPLFDLAHLAGVDIEKYFPLHVSSSVYILGQDDEVPKCSMTFFAADREVQGDNFDKVLKSARQNDNILPVIQISGDSVPLLDVLRIMKRTHIVLTLKSIKDEGIELRLTNMSES